MWFVPSSCFVFFPTCHVRVVRFYQSCSPPPPPPPVSPRPCLHQLPPPLPPCQLFAKLFANFPAQCALLDLNLGPSQRSAHRWTSTWDLPSSVRTAGPQRPDRMPEDMPDRMPEDMSDRMPEDLPVTKCINVMVGITRSKVMFSRAGFMSAYTCIIVHWHVGGWQHWT